MSETLVPSEATLAFVVQHPLLRFAPDAEQPSEALLGVQLHSFSFNAVETRGAIDYPRIIVRLLSKFLVLLFFGLLLFSFLPLSLPPDGVSVSNSGFFQLDSFERVFFANIFLPFPELVKNFALLVLDPIFSFIMFFVICSISWSLIRV